MFFFFCLVLSVLLITASDYPVGHCVVCPSSNPEAVIRRTDNTRQKKKNIKINNDLQNTTQKTKD
jgi:hypothetical protein